jgi:hypothetical protein
MRTDHAGCEQPTMNIDVSRVRWPAELAKFKGDNTFQFIATLAATRGMRQLRGCGHR